MKRLIPFMIASAFLVYYGCDVLGPAETEGRYPTTFRPLPASDLSKLKSEYATLNQNRICTSLNRYGFPEYDLGLCLNRPILRVPISESVDSAAARAKLPLLKNAKFTSVDDTAEVKLARAIPLNGCIKCDGSPGDIRQISWRFDFANQIYSGLEVEESGIVAFADAQGVYMLGGNRFKNIFVPALDRYTLSHTKELLVGRRIRVIGSWEETYYQITAESFLSDAANRKVILQVKQGEALELRVAWKIGVAWRTGQSSDPASPAWSVYVDTTTGEVLREDQLFILN